MHMFKLLVVSISIISLSALAGERVKLGISADVETEGFFNPTLISYTIQKVKSHSPAEKAGIIAGQKIIAIETCKIPGCSASEAQKLMQKESQDILNLLLENEDGSQIPIKITFNGK